MRIDAFQKVSQLYQSNSVTGKSKVKGSSHSDKLEISQVAKDYQVAKQMVAKTPDVREDKVNDLKQRIASGTYDVSAQELADKLVDNYFDEII
jgi:negative regulator of flagellin synthesis FlgM